MENPKKRTMKLSAFSGHPIEEVSFRGLNIHDMLCKLGIDDVEQLIAASAVKGIKKELVNALSITVKDLDEFILTEKQKLSARRYEEISEEVADENSLGAMAPTPEMLEELLREVPVTSFEDVDPISLPTSVNWINELNPIRNQGSRGTCVAFAVSAVHEFFRRRQGQVLDFSEQHLYYETKLIDGSPNVCGTWQYKAILALRDRGQCLENVWNYNMTSSCNAHGTMPSNARTNAANYKAVAARLPEKNINTIKATLANGGLVGFSVPVFNSWYKSAETARTGRITLPIGNEQVNGGHAMALVGYQDDANSPGGGFFILRNSWGTNWGAQCPYGAGYGTIPYQYIANHNWEAITIVPQNLINVTNEHQVEFNGLGNECWFKFKFFRISNLHPNRALRINSLKICSWNGSTLIDEFVLDLSPGGIFEPNQLGSELLLKNLRLRGNGNRNAWNYRFTWHVQYSWWQRSTAVTSTDADTHELVLLEDEVAENGGVELTDENSTVKTARRVINIFPGSDVEINLK